MENRITLGISSCLLGEQVRYDGSHKHNTYITETLQEYFDFISLCPERAIGLGVPRPPIRLVQIKKEDAIQALGVKDPGINPTLQLSNYAKEQASHLNGIICGYILKSKSPSCGMERVKVYHSDGHPIGHSPGIYAQELMNALNPLPFEEEGRLGDAKLRDNFIQRVFVYSRWKNMLQSPLTKNKLVQFHTHHKYMLMAHSQPHYSELGRMIAELPNDNLDTFSNNYFNKLMEALKILATRKNHVNVLAHLMGYLKNHLDADDKKELLECFEDYKMGGIPLIVPITLLNHHFRKHPNQYIENQYYLKPHPKELFLRSSVF